MKPTSHLVAGLAMGLGTGFVMGSEPLEFGLVTIATLIGSAVPDAPIAAQVLQDKRAGRSLFSAEFDSSVSFETTNWFLLKEVSHSPLIWITGLLVGALLYPALLGLLVLVFTLGVFSHWLIDVFTHVGSAFRDTDQSLLWPLYGRRRPGSIPKLGQIVGKMGLGGRVSLQLQRSARSGSCGRYQRFRVLLSSGGTRSLVPYRSHVHRIQHIAKSRA